MPHAASAFLNQSLRSEQQARDSHAKSEQERRQRLEQHGSGFCRRVLAGAFERIYQADGSYRLREIQSGVWLEELMPGNSTDAQRQPPPRPATPAPQSELPPRLSASAMSPGRHAAMIDAAQRLGYTTALRDVAHWISVAATQPRMDARTLAALNEELSRMSGCARIVMTTATTRQTS